MRRSVQQPTSDLTLYAGIFLKTWTVAEAGTMVPQHAHEHPHISFLVSGTIRAWCDGVPLGEFTAPAVLKIPAWTKHRFLTLTDGVVLACIHAADTEAAVVVTAEHVLAQED